MCEQQGKSDSRPLIGPGNQRPAFTCDLSVSWGSDTVPSHPDSQWREAWVMGNRNYGLRM